MLQKILLYVNIFIRSEIFMKIVDLENWNRKSHYELFNSYLQPCFRVDIRLDVTKLVKNREKYGGFFIPFTYLLMRALNNCEGTKIREVDKKLVVFDKVHPSFTVNLDDGNFAFCRCEYVDDFSVFKKSCREEIERAKKLAISGDKDYFTTNDRADLVYLSCLPWIDFLSVENPLPLGDKLSMSIPRLNWGKFVETEKGFEVTLSTTVNHAYIDGRELSSMLNEIKSSLENIDKILG